MIRPLRSPPVFFLAFLDPAFSSDIYYVISYILAGDPKTRIPLLLANKAVNASTQATVRRCLVDYVRKRYGDPAALLFPPKAQSMGREEYLGKVDKMMVSIGRALNFAKHRLEKYVDKKVEGWETMDVDQAVKLMRVGLFMVEAAQWDRTTTSKAWNMRGMVTSLPHGFPRRGRPTFAH